MSRACTQPFHTCKNSIPCPCETSKNHQMLPLALWCKAQKPKELRMLPSVPPSKRERIGSELWPGKTCWRRIWIHCTEGAEWMLLSCISNCLARLNGSAWEWWRRQGVLFAFPLIWSSPYISCICNMLLFWLNLHLFHFLIPLFGARIVLVIPNVHWVKAELDLYLQSYELNPQIDLLQA